MPRTRIQKDDEIVIRHPTSVTEVVERVDHPCDKCGAYIGGKMGSREWFEPCLNRQCKWPEGACRACGSQQGFSFNDDTSSLPGFGPDEGLSTIEFNYTCDACGHEIELEFDFSNVEYNQVGDDDD